MIEIQHVTKCFETVTALNDINVSIRDGSVYGLLGTNGAGKSTLLRVAAGILQCDKGQILVDGEVCCDRPDHKAKFFYLPDDPYYFPSANMEQMIEFYRRQYTDMDYEGAIHMAEKLELDVKRPIRTFSKGMKRQAFLIMALCANTEYLLCDEVFDGLDPVVTAVMKNLFRKEMEDRGLTIVVAAHKLQDLEGFCDEIGILHKGGVVLAGDMRRKSGELCKIQCVFEKEEETELREYIGEYLEIVRYRRDGYFTTLIARDGKEKAKRVIRKAGAVFCEEVPMTLEEVFIAEMEETGYDISKVLQ